MFFLTENLKSYPTLADFFTLRIKEDTFIFYGFNTVEAP